MRVAINHETVYRYHSPANYSIQYLRLTPLSGPNQRVISWKLSTPGNLRTWTDGFGNQAHVLVDEKGTEASAATEVGVAKGIERPTGFNADRPFIFVIRDVKTGSVLFLGRVMDPRA